MLATERAVELSLRVQTPPLATTTCIGRLFAFRTILSERASRRTNCLNSRTFYGAKTYRARPTPCHDLSLRSRIDVDVAGEAQADAPALVGGFVGIPFRVPPDASTYDYVYIRPTNEHADDQERRNHSTQYPLFPTMNGEGGAQ